MSQEAVILVAGGRGVRFGTAIPKQFLQLNGLPIYIQTIRQFVNYNKDMQFILVLPMQTSDEELVANRLQVSAFFDIDIQNCRGGITRFDSVKNGLGLINNGVEVIGIHDAVRPLVSQAVIKNCYETAKKDGNAIPVVDFVESLRRIDGDRNQAVNRSQYKLVQTPQCFQANQIKEAYEQPNEQHFTDDATVVEHMGHKIKIVEGNFENIKITTPPDLLYAEFLLQQANE